MSSSGGKTPVLIVGAGPTGLVLALWLRKKNVPFRIIDKNRGPGETSRALAVQARTLEFYRQLGIQETIISNGILTKQIVLCRLGRIVAKAKLGEIGKDVSPFSGLLFLSQDVHEKILVEELQKLNVRVERETELVSFLQNERGGSAKVQTAFGIEEIQFDYICGCDGAHSKVRHELGIDFPGGTYSQVFFVADVQATGDMAEGLQISVSRNDFCIVMPIKQQNSVRLTGIVPPENEQKEKITYEEVRESVQKNTRLHVERINWFSTYHVHHRVANGFFKGRAFLLGDAGHIHSPAGGQGMNTGIGDAVNLAWKLADVINGNRNPHILQSYEDERIRFARTLVASTDQAFRFIASRSVFGALWRAYLLPRLFAILTHLKIFLKLAFRTISQTRISYAESFLSSSSIGKVHSGERLPWIRFLDRDNHESLRSMTWQIHVYGEARSQLRSLASERNTQVEVFEFTNEAQEKGLVKDAYYLIRPDGHIALSGDQNEVFHLQTYFDQLVSRP